VGSPYLTGEKNMRKIKGIFVLAMFALPMLAACPDMGSEEANGGETCDPEDPTSCSADDELCHPYARVCVANCAMQEGACDETALPVCASEDPFTNICQCETTESCGDDEVCHPVTRLCENTCDPATDTCPMVGDEQWDCLMVEGESFEMDHDDAGTMTYDVYACQPPSGSCTGNEDICDADTEHCGPDGQCAPNCTNDNSIGDENDSGSVCLSTGRWVAKCVDTDCEAGEVCDANAENDTFNFCIDMLDAPCDTNGELYTDGNGDEHVCVDGTWEAACDQDTCAPDYQLCQHDETKTTFNECDEADNVTNTGCEGAAAFSETRSEDGPLIHLLVYKADDDTTDRTCTSGTPHLVSLHYSDPTPDAYASMDVDAYSALLWNRGDDNFGARSATNALEYSDDATDAMGNVTMVICFSEAPDDLAVQVMDAAGNTSNVACVTREDLLMEPGLVGAASRQVPRI
jgi:hypothetical protein